MFADRYIAKNIVYPEFIKQKPDNKLGMIVVIPCYREPEIIKTLQSLANCKRPLCQTEIIVVINQSEKDGPAINKYNKTTQCEIEKWKTENKNLQMPVFPIFPEPFPAKYAGAGMARKTGMDEAVRRFHSIDKKNGLIISLDADTTVDENYFTEIEKFFLGNPGYIGSTIRFRHRTDGTMSKKQIEGINLYERYLRYYKNALVYTGYPFAMFTVGSAFCCTAGAYVKQGGMNRKQAGEDFYFLHKLSQLGSIGEINTTCVYPSARLSDRVPFGTGPVLQRWISGRKNLNITYNFQSFNDLKSLFDKKDTLFKIGEINYKNFISQLPVSLQHFLIAENFSSELQVINENTSNLINFRKRFFQTFNAFKILKYINFSHQECYVKQNISEAENSLRLYAADS